MILKGSQRGGARQLAAHLLNDWDNDDVRVGSISGFVAGDLQGALTEAHAIAGATRCRQFLFSLSLSPPAGIEVPEEVLEAAVDEVGRRLGLSQMPRAVVYHAKKARRHAHAVWLRVDVSTMRAINLPFFKRRLTELSRELYLKHGWTLPNGLRHDGGKSPLNYTLAEWQKAQRLGLDPQEIRQSFIQAWAQSDCLASFRAALHEKGYALARGDRRGFVAVDTSGEVYAIARCSGVPTKEVRAKLGSPDSLPSVEEASNNMRQRMSEKLQCFLRDIDSGHETATAHLSARQNDLRNAHRAERARLEACQHERWVFEATGRRARFRSGLGGIWDRLTGPWEEITRRNTDEAIRSLERDRAQRDHLVFAQLAEMRALRDESQALETRYGARRAPLILAMARQQGP
jgi:hypothetical protein